MLKRISPSELLDVDARRICLIKPSALGDIVQTLPLLPVLRERFPHASICWVARSEFSDLLCEHPLLDDVIQFDRRSSWNGWMQLLGELRRREFDLVFDLQGLFRTALMTVATRAALRVGLETAREGAHLACNCTLPDTGKLVPAHLRYWRLAEAISMGDSRRETLVPIHQHDHVWAQAQCDPLCNPLLAVHPGGGWVTKRWPVENFAVLAAKATRLYGFSTVILGSRAEQPIAAQLEELLRGFVPAAEILNLSGKTRLKRLAAILQRSDVLLTNDSGPMHLAAGVGTPVIGVFTCTSPARSGPPGEKHELVTTTLSCAASYKKRCPYRGRRHLACMEQLSTEDVWQAFVRFMERYSSGQDAA